MRKSADQDRLQRFAAHSDGRLLRRCIYQALGGQFPPAYLVGRCNSRSPMLSTRSWAVLHLCGDLLRRQLWRRQHCGRPEFREGLPRGLEPEYAWCACLRHGASASALFVAWLYTRFDAWVGFGSLGLIGVIRSHCCGSACLRALPSARGQRAGASPGHGQGYRSTRSIHLGTLASGERAVARDCGRTRLSAREIEQVETAALLHDVGKIHEEFAPLLREGRSPDS